MNWAIKIIDKSLFTLVPVCFENSVLMDATSTFTKLVQLSSTNYGLPNQFSFWSFTRV